ncbi:MAG: hypothetical protein FWE22_02005 [Firmicutes bacterium]|nr:hypothetical protein [Bacillota bacterium]
MLKDNNSALLAMTKMRNSPIKLVSRSEEIIPHDEAIDCLNICVIVPFLSLIPSQIF